jgi:hypothetical protein
MVGKEREFMEMRVMNKGFLGSEPEMDAIDDSMPDIS